MKKSFKKGVMTLFKLNLQLHARQAIGVYTTLKMGFETEFGKDPADLATKAVQMPFNTCGLAASQNKTDPATIRGRRDPVEPIMGNIDVSGDLAVPMDATAFGYWWKAAMGAPVTTAVEGKDGFFKHVFKPADDQPSLVLEKGFSKINSYAKYNGCKVSKISISAGGDGELTATISIMGCDEKISTTTICANPSEPVMNRLNNFMANLILGGNKTATVTAFTMDIDFGLDGDTYALGGKGYRTAVNEGLINISGSMTAFFCDNTYLELAENNMETSAELTLEVGELQMSLLLPEIKFSRNSPAVDGPSGIKQELQYSAYYQDSDENAAIVVTMQNKVASYE